jgi:hypothetical protein
MAFRAGNRMTPREQKNMSDLFTLIEQSNNSELQQEADMYKLRQTFGRDSMESESSQFEGTSEAVINNSQAEYDGKREWWRTVGTNGGDFDKNRAAVLRESGNADSLIRRNAALSKDYSGFAKPDYSR